LSQLLLLEMPISVTRLWYCYGISVLLSNMWIVTKQNNDLSVYEHCTIEQCA